MAAEASGGEAVASAKRPFSFLDLPTETQEDIISHCSQSDLICLALVSKRMHELASTQLYRNFHIVFPDDDDVNFDSPIDGLAGGLDTFTTSEYNYAKHLRDLSMDTLSAGVKGEQSYQPYLYSASCGKFLNTLLYLTLKKAKSLEAFRWNIRVELSRPVYRELHRIASLTKLHIRMQAGESYYNHPPPLPVSPDPHTQPTTGHWSAPPVGPSSSLFSSATVQTSSPPQIPGGPPPVLEPQSRLSARSSSSKRGTGTKEPSTFSGFKNLKSLSVLDIDGLDAVSELRTCVKNSYSTLKELQLSLSDSLAQQARKPPPESDADDSDVDDDFHVVPASQNTNYDTTGPAKAFRAQEERKFQEAILGRILDVEQTLTKKSPMQQYNAQDGSSTDKGKDVDTEANSNDPREAFVSSIRKACTKLMALQQGSREFTIAQQDILDTIERAARKYVDSADAPPKSSDVTSSPELPGELGLDDDQQAMPTLALRPKVDADMPKEVPNLQVGEQSSTANGAATGPLPPGPRTTEDTRLDGEEPSPDDIDIAHVHTIADELEGSVDEPSDPLTTDEDTLKTLSGTRKPDPSMSELTRLLCTGTDPLVLAEAADEWDRQWTEKKARLEPLTDRLRLLQSQTNILSQQVDRLRSKGVDPNCPEMQLLLSKMHMLNRNVTEIFDDVRAVEDDVGTVSEVLSAELSGVSPTSDRLRRYMDAYMRETRGLALETLKIHLIPVKASALSRGVDLACLKQLTLLNVGSQTPIWALLAKEGKTRPLALRTVFTDHVTTTFLSCMAQLPELHDLFLLERGLKHKPESFAPRTTTTIDQIRRLVLKKHMHTLKRLMIKDESNGPNWDANEKTMILICTRGANLEELALSMNIHAVHAFMQYFSGLINLRAINILHFRNNDTCIWVMREILRFIVDNLSHHPELKLEWIAMEDERVERVVRPSETQDKVRQDEPANRSKGKGKEKSHVLAGAVMDNTYPLLPVDGLDSDSDSEDESRDDGRRLRFQTFGPLQFYDLWGVKIFEKEIRSGRL
ncbi:F-box domain-containing protein [Purpureocillium lilacinum]|uniref:F-box domain-containing protein n=2 Tax=Purpureocillium lilacinum TaxID=33203 RepID=A0A179HZ43_PURLI|nr:F-box domain-containing protein [Purpureocillium lilacinum]OAQ94699.1 F-box domain-containing protein [Purpureocillium lilacinum]